MRYVVTLVHGTWARGAPWTQDGSPLRQKLKDALGSDVRFERFDWTGWNRQSARHAAAECLAGKLRAVIGEERDARHFVVGHSHGGLVALYALQADQGLRDRIDGVACLSTPFLHARRRYVGRSMSEALAALLAFGGLAALVWTLTSLSVRGLSSLMLAMGGAVLLVLLMVSAVVVGLRWTKKADHLLETFALPDLREDQLLIVRTTGDEAATALGAAHLLALMITRPVQVLDDAASGPAKRLGIRIDAAGPWLPVLVMAGLALVFVAEWLAPGRVPPGLGYLVLLPILLVAAWYYLPALVAYVLEAFAGLGLAAVSGLVSLLMLPFDRRAALFSLLVEPAAEPTPEGCWRVHHVPVEAGPGLSHSAAYEVDQALHVLAEWMMGPHDRAARR